MCCWRWTAGQKPDFIMSLFTIMKSNLLIVLYYLKSHENKTLTKIMIEMNFSFLSGLLLMSPWINEKKKKKNNIQGLAPCFSPPRNKPQCFTLLFVGAGCPRAKKHRPLLTALKDVAVMIKTFPLKQCSVLWPPKGPLALQQQNSFRVNF